MGMELWWNEEPKCSDKNQSHLHYLHRKFYMYWPGMEARPLR